MTGNKGCMSIGFSELFADTILAHGYEWTKALYIKRGMSEQEFGVWFLGFCISQVSSN